MSSKSNKKVKSFKDFSDDFCKIFARKLRPSAAKWNAEHRNLQTRGTSEWKQLLKSHFVHLTKFSDHHSRPTKGKWKQDLRRAATLTIMDICPLWQNNSSTHAATQDLVLKYVIEKEVKNKSPRKTWLEEKAYAWLKCLPAWFKGSEIQVEKVLLHPGHAISVAYHIFLGSPYKFKKFAKYLRARRNEAIEKLLSAHDEEIARLVF